jgi:hypothetical protein
MCNLYIQIHKFRWHCVDPSTMKEKNNMREDIILYMRYRSWSELIMHATMMDCCHAICLHRYIIKFLIFNQPIKD